MKKIVSSSKVLKITNFMQLLILGACFYIFSSKIPMLPWYSPLTSYILLHLIILLSIQLIIFFYAWFMREKYIVFHVPMQIGMINILLILSMFFISIVSILLFNILTIFCTFIEIALLIYLLRTVLNLPNSNE
ncbi:hypothetical protein [Cellulosilyticum sp. I15G10I2]|uniref:hypothetical protein n=1 Tax=Cellulosilyticum sp. I15G10I2 TaxID=1892843 RepID=UPI00085C6BE8|nr:hypothetical protein [Cellulosilyticum sp. I15G10I2]